MKYDLTLITKDLDKYQKIMSLVNKTNVYKDKEFRRLFCGYYKLRQKTKYFYEVFFEYMENSKNKIPMFDTALRYIYEKTGEVHYSFCSKLIATLDPSSPILDQYVLRHCGFAILDSTVNPRKRIEYYTYVYYTIASEYNEALINSETIKNFIKEFDSVYPQFSSISNIKKLDSFLVSKATERATPYLKNLQYYELIMSMIKRNDRPFSEWVKEVKIASGTPVTSGLYISIEDNIEDISPDILKFLIECFEKGMTPFEAVIEWA